MNITAREVSMRLAQRADDVTKYLFPNGKISGNEFCVGSLAGEPGESLKIHLRGDKAGVFCDFASGESGDLLDAWSLGRSITTAKAFYEAKQWLRHRAAKFRASEAKKSH
jgi:twinkle protein